MGTPGRPTHVSMPVLGGDEGRRGAPGGGVVNVPGFSGLAFAAGGMVPRGGPDVGRIGGRAGVAGGGVGSDERARTSA